MDKAINYQIDKIVWLIAILGQNLSMLLMKELAIKNELDTNDLLKQKHNLGLMFDFMILERELLGLDSFPANIDINELDDCLNENKRRFENLSKKIFKEENNFDSKTKVSEE